jgi:hypothetical protein
MRAVLTLLSLLAVDFVCAGVYKWTDSQGRVHYGDTPPPQQPAQTLRTDKTDETAAAAARQSLANKLTESALKRQQAREAEDKRRAEAEAAQRRAEQCQRARERLTLLQQNVPVMRIDAQGQRQVLSPAERAAALQAAQRQIDENCR